MFVYGRGGGILNLRLRGEVGIRGAMFVLDLPGERVRPLVSPFFKLFFFFSFSGVWANG